MQQLIDQGCDLMNNAKWGFGMAPLKSITDLKNKQALRKVKKFVIGEDIVEFDTLPENISLVKGLFNRVIKQDQWDWCTLTIRLTDIWKTLSDLCEIFEMPYLITTTIWEKKA